MELKPGYKQTEAGVIPEDWSSNSLVSLCIPGGLVRGPFGGSLKKEFFVKEGYKVYEQRNAIYKSVKIGSYFIDKNKYLELKRFDVIPGDFIVSCSGTIGRIFQIPKGAKAGVINQALLKIKLNPSSVTSDYFYQAFVWDKFQQKIVDSTQGGAMQNLVGMDVFKNTPLALPPLPEQRAIAAALSDTDALIESLDRLLAKKRDIKQAVMQQLLTGKKRLPGFNGKWTKNVLEQIIDCLDNLRVPLNEAQRNQMRGDYPYCGANGVLDYVNDYVIDDEIVLIAEDGGYFDEYAYRPIAYKIKGKCWVNNHAHILKAKSGYSQDFIYYSLVHKNILSFLASGTRAKLNKSEMYKIEINLPYDLNEQTAIAGVLSDMDAEIDALQQRRDKTRAIKQGMMQELLTGRTRLV